MRSSSRFVRVALAAASLTVIRCTPLKNDVPADASIADSAGTGDASIPGVDASDAAADTSIPDATSMADATSEADVEAPAIELSLDKTRLNIVRGSSVSATAVLLRRGGLTGTVTGIVANLPTGVTCDPIAFLPGTTTQTMTLHAALDAELGPRVQLSLQGDDGAQGSYTAKAAFDLLVQDASGTLDSTFGNGGIATVPIGLSVLRVGGQGIAVQSDGKLLVCGVVERSLDRSNVPESVGVARLTDQGAIDTSFGSLGTVVIVQPSTQWHEVCGAIRAMDDKRVVIGGFTTTNTTQGPHGFLAARLLENGSPDPTFNQIGSFRLNVNGAESKGFGLALQSDGSMVLGGYAGTTGDDSALLKLTKDGALAAFGPGGIGAVVAIDPGAVVTGLALYPDGRIAISSAHAPSGATAIRFSPSGVRDPSYAPPTLNTAQVTDASGQMVLQPDQKIALVATVPGTPGTPGTPATPSAIQLARFTFDGFFDPTFANNGTTTTTIAGSDTSATAITLLPDGAFAVSAAVAGPDPQTFGVLRYTANGSLDVSFGAGGYATPISGRNAIAQAITSDSEGRIIAAGVADGAAGRSAVVVRFWP